MYMRSVLDRNVVMWRMTCTMPNVTLQATHHSCHVFGTGSVEGDRTHVNVLPASKALSSLQWSVVRMFKQSTGVCRTHIMLTWRIWWATNSATNWQMLFKLMFEGLQILKHNTEWNLASAVNLQWKLHRKWCSGGG